MLAILEIVRKIFTKENSSKFGIGVLVVLCIIVVVVQKGKIDKLRNDLAAAHPDTVYVTQDKIVNIPYPDTVVLKSRDSVWVRRVVRDTVYDTKEYFDTVVVQKNGLLKFKDDSNDLVAVQGTIDYPHGTRLELVYTTKKFYDLQKKWGVFINAGIARDKQPIVGATAYYDKVEFGAGIGKELWYVRLGIRLF